MKPLNIFIFLLILWFWCINLSAGKIYTWTDENGVIHITEDPPPASGRLEEVIDYTPKTEEEIRDIRQQQESRRTQRVKELALQSAQKARKIADETNIRAQEAARKADEADKRAQEFKDKIGYDTDRIKRNRSKIRKLELEAFTALNLARQAAEEARKAEEQAKTAEQRVKEIINREKESDLQPAEVKR